MTYNPQIHHRRSIRLKEYDYSQDGAYFITICTQNHECLFGRIENEKMILNDAGEIMQKWWLELQNKFINFELGAFVVMPNHFHGIILIQNKTVRADLRVCPKTYVCLEKPVCPICEEQGENIIKQGEGECVIKQGEHVGSPVRGNQGNRDNIEHLPKKRDHAPISEMIQWFKTMTTNEYIRGVKSGKFPSFDKRIWQRNYYEHIIRNEQSYEKIYDYIIHNPKKWAEDKFYMNV